MTSGASTVGNGRHATLWGALVAVSLHALVALGLTLVPRRGLHDDRALPVEVDVLPPPPAEPPTPPPPEPPPPPPELVRPVVRRAVATIKPPPPMPNQEVKPSPPADEPVQPVFGVTQDSVVPGESPVAVPVGNTLMTKDRTVAAAAPPLPAAPPPPAFAPVDEESVAEWPKESFKPDAEYPEVARRMGIEGRVLVRIGIDRKGNVKSARVLEKVGYGMDEAAVKAILQFKFKPARRADGEPVDIVITYGFVFKLPGN